MNNTCSGSYIATVGIPTHDRFASDTFQMSTTSRELNPLTNFSHSLYLKVSSIKVLIAR